MDFGPHSLPPCSFIRFAESGLDPRREASRRVYTATPGLPSNDGDSPLYVLPET